MPSHTKCTTRILSLALLAACYADAQNWKTVAAGTVETIPVNLDPSATQGATIHLAYSDKALTISLIPPSGTVVNTATAGRLGYGWQQVTRGGRQEDDSLPGDDEGRCLLIGLPAGAVAGVYYIRVDATAAAPHTSAIVQATGSTGLVASLAGTRESYLPDEPVVLTGVVTDGARILQNPTMTLAVERTAPVGSGLSMTNVRLVRSQAMAGSGYRHYYTGDLASQSVSAKTVSARAEGVAGTVKFAQDRLSFLSVEPGSTSATTATVSVDTNGATAPAARDWAWSFEATDHPVTVKMPSSGTDGQFRGNGLITGVFTTSKPGDYSASLTATGVSPSGTEYRRIASRSFRVEVEDGRILACSDQPWDDDGDGLYDRLEATLQVYVSQAARYGLHLDLEDSSGKTVPAGRTESLVAGYQVVRLEVSAHSLRSTLGADGPYRRTSAQLWRAESGHVQQISSAPCGTTRAYRLADFALDPVRLSSTGTLTPVNRNGIAGYESLEYAQPLIAPAADCHWYATLESADGTRLDAFNGNRRWPGGSGTVAATFSGPKIGRSGKVGPYQVGTLRVTCAGQELFKRGAARSAEYSAADFEATPADFSISARNITAQAGAKATSAVFTAASGGFEGMIGLAVSGLPTGWTATLQLPKVDAGGAVNLDIVPASGSIEGAYPLTVTGTSGNLTHSAPLTAVVTAKPVTVSIQPSYAVLHPGQTRQFSAQVYEAPDPSFVWKVPSLGSVTAGLYQAPESIASHKRTYVVAASTLDVTKFAAAYVDLYPPARVAVSPAAATLSAGQSQYVVANVQNVQSPSVQWSMSPQVGTLTATSSVRAVYVAPSPIGTAQTITLTATSVEDPSQSASMTISLQP